jgi:hypothetical protein
MCVRQSCSDDTRAAPPTIDNSDDSHSEWRKCSWRLDARATVYSHSLAMQRHNAPAGVGRGLWRRARSRGGRGSGRRRAATAQRETAAPCASTARRRRCGRSRLWGSRRRSRTAAAPAAAAARGCLQTAGRLLASATIAPARCTRKRLQRRARARAAHAMQRDSTGKKQEGVDGGAARTCTS